jgi:hypothetical protein
LNGLIGTKGTKKKYYLFRVWIAGSGRLAEQRRKITVASGLLMKMETNILSMPIAPHTFHGKPFAGKPADGSFICHKCGVGLCVRPSHLYAGTAATNGKDTADMGRAGKGKLTYQQAYEIRCAYQSGEKLQDIADRYGVAFGTVYPIVMGKAYKYAPFPQNYIYGQRFRAPLRPDELKDIREMLSRGISQYKIAKKHNIAQSIISRINTGDRHVGK